MTDRSREPRHLSYLPHPPVLRDTEGADGTLDAWAYGTQLRPDELAPGCRWVSYRGKASNGS